ncbi:hypothetical protein V8E55_007874 [Tylopilus felleus]
MHFAFFAVLSLTALAIAASPIENLQRDVPSQDAAPCCGPRPCCGMVSLSLRSASRVPSVLHTRMDAVMINESCSFHSPQMLQVGKGIIMSIKRTRRLF